MFRRKIEILCAGRKFESDLSDRPGYWIDFEIPFSEKSEPQLAKIEIFNLARDTRNIFQEGEIIIVNAGYGDDIGTIFAGTIENVVNRVDGVDIVTHIEAGDGASEWNNAYISLSFSPGSDAKTVISGLLSSFGLSVGKLDLTVNKVYANGKSVQGALLPELKKIVSDCESKIYTSGGLIYILPLSAGMEEVTVLNKDTGLVESPIEHTDEEYDGYMINMLLNNKVNVGSKVRIESKFASGLYRVVKGRHSGEEFLTEAVVVDGT